MWIPSGHEHVRRMGRGLRCEVHLCRDVHRDELVGLKIAADPEARIRLREEYQALRRVDHPALPSVRGFRSDEARSWLTYAFVPGRGLREGEDLVEGGPDRFDAVAAGVFGALLVLHDLGQVHYDLSPRHVIVDEPASWDRVRLIDLGHAGPPGRTLLGTPGYMAPELLRGEPGDRDSDVYAAAVVLAEMVLAERLLGGRTQREVMAATSGLPAAIGDRLREVVGPDRAALLLDALEPDRRNRAGDAFEHLERLRAMGVAGADRSATVAVTAVVRSALVPDDAEASLVSLGWERGSASDLARKIGPQLGSERFDPARLVAGLVLRRRVRRRQGTWILVGQGDDWLVDGLDDAAIREEMTGVVPAGREAVLALAALAERGGRDLPASTVSPLDAGLRKARTDLVRPTEGGGWAFDPPAVALAVLRGAALEDVRAAHALVARVLEAGCDDPARIAYHRLRAGEPAGPEIAGPLADAVEEGRLDLALPIAGVIRAELEEDRPVPGPAVLAAFWAEVEGRRWARAARLCELTSNRESPGLSYLDALVEVRTTGVCTWRRGRPEGEDADVARLSVEMTLPGSGGPDPGAALARLEGAAGSNGGEATVVERLARLEAWAISGSTLRSRAFLSCVSAIGDGPFASGDHETAREIMEFGRDLARRQGMRLRASLLEGNVASCLIVGGRHEEAAALLRNLVEERQTLGDEHGAISVWGNLGVVRYEEGDTESALASWRRQEELVRRTGETRLLGSTRCRIACALQETGDWAAAEAEFEASVRLCSAFGRHRDQAVARMNLVLHHLVAGRIARARTRLDRLESALAAEPGRFGDRRFLAHVRERILLAEGEVRWGSSEGLALLRGLAEGETEAVPDLDVTDAVEILLRTAAAHGLDPEDESVLARIREAFPDEPLLDLLTRYVAPSGGPTDEEFRRVSDAIRERVLDTDAVEILTVLLDAAIRREASGCRVPGAEDLRGLALRSNLPGPCWRAELVGALRCIRRGELEAAARRMAAALDGLEACFGEGEMRATVWARPEIRALTSGLGRLARQAGVFVTREPGSLATCRGRLAEIAMALGERAPGREAAWEARVERILSVTESLNTTVDLDGLLDQVIETMLGLSDAEYGYVVLLDEEGRPEVRVARSTRGGQDREIRSKVSRTVIDRVLAERRPVLIPNALDEVGLDDRASVRSLSLRSVMGAPLVHRGTLLGAICVDNRSTAGSFRDQDLRLLAVFANQATVAIQNSRLFRDLEASYRDLAGAREEIARSEALNNLGVLAGGIAHDFNNMLLAILGNVDLALRDSGLAEATARKLEAAKGASLRASALCEQLLVYAGRARPDMAEVDVGTVVRRAAEAAGEAGPDGVEFRVEVPDAPIEVEADEMLVRRIVANLVSNALESFEEDGGTVDVRTRVRDLDDAALRSMRPMDDLPPGGYVVLEVADTGRGMDETVRRRAFEPFFSTRRSGRGMGLAAVLGGVRAHGGSIALRSDPGEGTCVTVLLPARTGSARETADAVETGGAILLVDDEPVVLSVTSEMLSVLGHPVLTAAGGAEAVEVFREHADEIRLVLLDMQMPDLGGGEVFERLREIRADVRVVISSGYTEEETLADFGENPPIGFLAKPYQLDDLRQRVGRYL